jgi:L-threonylcarbamoyladenylate synthase
VTARIRPATDLIALADAAAVLQRGGLVAFPTETVYGLGANALDEAAVARIFEAKARPEFDPLIVHVAEARDVTRVAVTDDPRVAALGERFWPGPLTLVLPKRPEVPEIVTAGLSTVGVRVPGYALARALLATAGVPVAAPSANPFGALSPTTAAHVADSLGGRVDLILDGGPCRVGVESTVLSLVSEPPLILRPGGLGREELEIALGRPLETQTSSSRPLSPGQLGRHYATQTPLRLLEGRARKDPGIGAGRVGLLAFRRAPENHGYAAVEVLAEDGRLTTAAARLFAALRRLDDAGLDVILAEPVPEEGLGRAIRDRLTRAAAKA